MPLYTDTLQEEVVPDEPLPDPKPTPKRQRRASRKADTTPDEKNQEEEAPASPE